MAGGFHGDCSATVGLPELDEEGQLLMACAKAALDAGIEAVRAGERLCTVGIAIENVVQKGGYNVCREFIGHGIGRDFHALPDVHHYDVGTLRRILVPVVLPGMVFTIEVSQ